MDVPFVGGRRLVPLAATTTSGQDGREVMWLPIVELAADTAVENLNLRF